MHGGSCTQAHRRSSNVVALNTKLFSATMRDLWTKAFVSTPNEMRLNGWSYILFCDKDKRLWSRLYNQKQLAATKGKCHNHIGFSVKATWFTTIATGREPILADRKHGKARTKRLGGMASVQACVWPATCSPQMPEVFSTCKNKWIAVVLSPQPV